MGLKGSETVEEIYEYRHLGVLKTYVGSFSSSVIVNVEKTQKKVGMLFSANFNQRKVNPFVYIKFWRQACLPSLLFGSQLFTVTRSRGYGQIYYRKTGTLSNVVSKKVFFVPKSALNLLILQLAGLNSIESETDIRKLLFLGRLLTEPKMTFVVKSLFSAQSYELF